MTAANAYRAKSCNFASSAKLGVISIETTINGNTTDLNTDAALSVTAVFVDALVADVTVGVTAIDGTTGLTPGDTGSLVVVFEKRAEGRSPAGSGNLTATFANAVVTSVKSDGPAAGHGSATVTWRCSNPSSGSPVSWS